MRCSWKKSKWKREDSVRGGNHISVHCWKFTEYDPVLGSFFILKLSVDNPNGFKHILPKSLSFAAMESTYQRMLASYLLLIYKANE